MTFVSLAIKWLKANSQLFQRNWTSITYHDNNYEPLLLTLPFTNDGSIKTVTWCQLFSTCIFKKSVASHEYAKLMLTYLHLVGHRLVHIVLQCLEPPPHWLKVFAQALLVIHKMALLIQPATESPWCTAHGHCLCLPSHPVMSSPSGCATGPTDPGAKSEPSVVFLLTRRLEYGSGPQGWHRRLSLGSTDQ